METLVNKTKLEIIAADLNLDFAKNELRDKRAEQETAEKIKIGAYIAGALGIGAYCLANYKPILEFIYNTRGF